MNRQSRGRRRFAFTLIEIMIVITIITVLAALVLAAINSTIKQKEDAARQTELRAISDMLEKFKLDHHRYPPSRIYLFEDLDYSPNAALNDEVRLRSIKYLQAIWPDLPISTTGPAPAAQQMDWNGDGLTNAKMELFGDQCLAFFLGGVPDTVNTSAGSGRSILLKGFLPIAASPAPVEPTGSAANPWLSTKSSKYFDFAPSRLRWKATNNPFTSAAAAAMPIYVNNGGDVNATTPLGIFYFSAYEGTGYQPEDGGPDASKPNEPMPTVNVVKFVQGNSATVITAMRKGPNPYGADPVPTDATKVGSFFKPETFQLIDPGADGLYGPGGGFPVSAYGDGGADNMTNFTVKKLGNVKSGADL